MSDLPSGILNHETAPMGILFMGPEPSIWKTHIFAKRDDY